MFRRGTVVIVRKSLANWDSLTVWASSKNGAAKLGGALKTVFATETRADSELFDKAQKNRPG